MSEPQLNLVDRSSKLYNNAKAALRDGHVPGVLYSKGADPQTFFVNDGELSKLLLTYGTNRKVTITLNDKKAYAIIKDYQKNMLKNQLIHIDLQTLNENEKIKVSSTIHFTNRETIEQKDKILQIQMNEIEIQMFPRHMPDSVTADASLLLERDSITVADLNIFNDKNIEILAEPEAVIATLVYAQLETEEPSDDIAADPANSSDTPDPSDAPENAGKEE